MATAGVEQNKPMLTLQRRQNQGFMEYLLICKGIHVEQTIHQIKG